MSTVRCEASHRFVVRLALCPLMASGPSLLSIHRSMIDWSALVSCTYLCSGRPVGGYGKTGNKTGKVEETVISIIQKHGLRSRASFYLKLMRGHAAVYACVYVHVCMYHV